MFLLRAIKFSILPSLKIGQSGKRKFCSWIRQIIHRAPDTGTCKNFCDNKIQTSKFRIATKGRKKKIQPTNCTLKTPVTLWKHGLLVILLTNQQKILLANCPGKDPTSFHVNTKNKGRFCL